MEHALDHRVSQNVGMPLCGRYGGGLHNILPQDPPSPEDPDVEEEKPRPVLLSRMQMEMQMQVKVS